MTVEEFEIKLKKAKASNSLQMQKIDRWKKEYDGVIKKKAKRNHSDIVWRIVQKQGETLISSLSKPFISGDKNIMITPMTKNDSYKAKLDEGILNHFHDKKMDKNDFYKNLTRVMVQEGTAWVSCGWDFVETSQSQEINRELSEEESQNLASKGFETETRDGSTIIIKKRTIENNPATSVVENGSAYPDPDAKNYADMKYFILEDETTLSDMISKGHIYKDNEVAKIKEELKREVSGVYGDNDVKLEEKKFKLYQYWGKADIENKGEYPMCVGVFMQTGKKVELIKMTKTPYPHDRIPYVPFQFVKQTNTVWGNGLAYLVADIQEVYTHLMRGILDNTAFSNNGQKFFRKNALDNTNLKRYLEKDKFVEVNTSDSISNAMQDGGFNQIPQSIFQLLNNLDVEAESLTGVNKMMLGITGAHMNASSSNFSATMNMGQIRLLDITHNISFGMNIILRMWASMSNEWLSNEEKKSITGMDIDQIKIEEVQKLSKEYGVEELPADVAQKATMIIMEEVNDLFENSDIEKDITIKVGTDGLKEIKINQLNMLMQQVGSLSQIVDPSILKDLLAEYASLMDFPVVSDNIKAYVPQPDPISEQMKQLEVAHRAAETKKEEALGDNAQARAESLRKKSHLDDNTREAKSAQEFAKLEKTYTEIEEAKKDGEHNRSNKETK